MNNLNVPVPVFDVAPEPRHAEGYAVHVSGEAPVFFAELHQTVCVFQPDSHVTAFNAVHVLRAARDFEIGRQAKIV